MQHALELYESQAFLKAEKAFIDLRISHPTESAKYLYLISKRLGKHDLYLRYNDYINELSNAQNFSEISFFHKTQSGPLSIKNRLVVLRSFWEVGDLVSFEKEASRTWSEIIEKKYYNYSDDLFNIISKYDPYLVANYFGQLTALMETHRHEEASKLAQDILSLIESKWSRLKTVQKSKGAIYKSLAQLMTTTHTGCLSLEKTRLETLILCEHESNRKGPSLAKLAMEFAILFKDDRKKLGLLLRLDMKQRQFLEDHLNKRPVANLNGVKKKLQLDPIENELDHSESFPPFKTFLDLPSSVDEEERLPNQNTIISSEEKELISRIKAHDPELTRADKLESVAHSLFGIGYYNACARLIDAADRSEGLAYLKCQALWETGDYLKLLDYSSTFSERLDPEDKVPFWYLGAKAAIQLRKNNQARGLLQQIAKIDPNFRNAKELLRSETP